MDPLDMNKFRNQIDLYLDNALPNQDLEELLKQLNSSPQAQRILSEEQSFRSFIKNNYKRPSLDQSLVDNIKSHLDIG